MSEGKTCKGCGKPAEYIERGKLGSAVCGACVHFDAGGDMGERFGAATMFMVAAQAAHHSGLRASDLHALVTEEALTHDWNGDVDVPWLNSIEEPRAERSRFAGVQPIRGRGGLMATMTEEERFGQVMVDVAEYMHRRIAQEPDLAAEHELTRELSRWATRLGVRGAARTRRSLMVLTGGEL